MIRRGDSSAETATGAVHLAILARAIKFHQRNHLAAGVALTALLAAPRDRPTPIEPQLLTLICTYASTALTLLGTETGPEDLRAALDLVAAEEPV